MAHPALPVIVDKVSYSSLMDFKKCGWFYKLVHIYKLAPEPSTVQTRTGQLLHKAVQTLIANPASTEDQEIKEFSEKLQEYYDKNEVPETILIDDVKASGVNIITNLRSAFKSVMGDVDVVAIEEKLKEPIDSRYRQIFKGSVDIVFKRKSDGKIILADFKTCNTSYWFLQYLDKFKEMQLVLYKYFYCRKNNIDPDDVETYFILLEKDLNSKKPVNFHRITSAKVKTNNGFQYLLTAVAAINNRIFLKNRSSCDKCKYRKTADCP
jgi:hypothetical protein